MIAGRQQAHRASQDGRHAGGSRYAKFCAFQRSQALLECSHRGVGEAGVDVARLLADKALRRLFGGIEYEAGSEKQRFGMLIELGAVRARAHRQGVEIVFFSHGLILLNSTAPSSACEKPRHKKTRAA